MRVGQNRVKNKDHFNKALNTGEATREVRTFADLAHGADILIKKTDQEVEGSYYTIMGSLLLTTFTFEAYLNHLGKKKITFWDKIESINVFDKYSVLCKEFDIFPDFSVRPHQTLKALFQFRNAIAHGKSITKIKTVSSQDDPSKKVPKAEWEEYCNMDNAKRAKEDVSRVIIELHKKAGLGNYPFVCH